MKWKELQEELIPKLELDPNKFQVFPVFNRKVKPNKKGEFEFRTKADEKRFNEVFSLLELKTTLQKEQELNKTVLKLVQKKSLEFCNFETSLNHLTFKNFLIRNRELSYKESSRVIIVLYAIELFNSLPYEERMRIYEEKYEKVQVVETTEPTEPIPTMQNNNSNTLELLGNSLLKGSDPKTTKVLLSLFERELLKQDIAKELKIKMLISLITSADNEEIKAFALTKVQELN